MRRQQNITLDCCFCSVPNATLGQASETEVLEILEEGLLVLDVVDVGRIVEGGTEGLPGECHHFQFQDASDDPVASTLMQSTSCRQQRERQKFD
jgi:hypothetical protein